MIEVWSLPFIDDRQAFQIVCVCRSLQSKYRDLEVESHATAFTRQSWVRFAHDFNNLLTPVILYSDLLASEVELECGLRRHAEIINQSGLSAARLIREITVQLSQAGPAATASWNEIALRMTDTLRGLVGPSIQIKTELTEPMGALRIGPTNVHRIILGLVLNAQKAMPKGGIITLSTRRCKEITDSVTRMNQSMFQTEFVVTDTGRGISKKTRTLTSVRNGSLRRASRMTSVPGLEIIKDIVKRAGGELKVESELGAGTNVLIRAPAKVIPDTKDPNTSNIRVINAGIGGSVHEQKVGHNG